MAITAKTLKIKQWTVSGLNIRYLSMPGKVSSTYRWRANENAVSLVINLAGSVDIQLAGHEKPIHFLPNTCNFFFATSPEGTVTNLDTFSEMLVIQFEAAYFLRLIKELNLSKSAFANGVESGKPILLFGHSAQISQPIQRISMEIINLPTDEKYRGLMLTAKCPELLLYVLDLFEKQGSKKWVHCKTEYDRERIEFAKNYLLQNAGNPPSLTELSRLAGINLFKLKGGFKEIFGQTVFGFLNEYRLEIAQKEIAAGAKSLTQIAFNLGYSSLPHFSLAYKKKFGRSPRAAKS